MKINLLFLMLLCCLNHPGYSGEPGIPNKVTTALADSVITIALTELTGYDLLGEICKIGPRLSGSEQSIKAIMFAKQKMELMGFDSVWLQKTMVPHWERGNVEQALLTTRGRKNYKLSIAALGGSVATSKSGLSAEVVEISSYDELKARATEIKGKIVFYNVPFDHSLVNTFAGYGIAVRYRSTGAIEAARYGAVAAILRSITTRNDNTPHVGMIRYDTTITKIPYVAIGIQDAELLSQRIKSDPQSKVNLKLNCKINPDAESYNLICEIKGSRYPNEIVVVSGHFDSWDQGEGAHDDAAGCVQSLEALSIIKKLNIKPSRTIRCIFYMNEENGVRGARTYADYAQAASEIHYAAIESDRGAFTPRGFSVDSDSLTIVYMQKWLPLLKRTGIEWISKGGSGVDISFLKNTRALIGYVPDDQRYFDYHHSANDVFSEVNPREFALGSSAITLLALLISEEGLD
ncbi:MAG: M20/M25/M40 family metallo-hydrolase [Ignavibacteriaceae bacterium]|nr:M20/M25/M40 family metallo-hydrolase [Ignavibacteriaceae bacterium]